MPILLGDINDQPSIDAIAKDTHVIVSTAGPFMRLGKPIVDAAVRQGTHYCDITGTCCSLYAIPGTHTA